VEFADIELGRKKSNSYIPSGKFYGQKSRRIFGKFGGKDFISDQKTLGRIFPELSCVAPGWFRLLREISPSIQRVDRHR
jgi:hypothetical protein